MTKMTKIRTNTFPESIAFLTIKWLLIISDGIRGWEESDHLVRNNN